MLTITKFWRRSYADIPQDSKTAEDAESLLPEDNLFPKRQGLASRQGTSLPRILLLILSHALLAAFAAFVGSTWRLDPAAFCSRVTTAFSPFINDVGLKYHTVEYNGSFFDETVFRYDAGPEVDAAWASLGVDYRAVAVPEELAVASGIATDQVRIQEKYGGGYPANVEGLHHLHCLNLLRKSLKWNYDYYHDLGEGAFKNSDHVAKYHVTHCLDILRQQLMCTVDVGMLGQVWWDPAEPKSFVDFNTKHVCRNFEAVRQWAEVRQLSDEVPADFLAPPVEGARIAEKIP